MENVKVLAQAKPHDSASMTAVILSLGLWDAMSIEERRRAIQNGEVLDTPSGRILFKLIRRMLQNEKARSN